MSSLPATPISIPSDPVIFSASQPDREVRLSPAELAALIEATQRYFPGEVVVESQSDPEYPNETYTVLHASASGDPEAIARQHYRWAEMLVGMGQTYCAKVRLALAINSNG